MEHEYGPDQMKKFLKYELDNYLQRPRVRAQEGAAAAAGREPGVHPLPQGLAGDVRAARLHRRGRAQRRAGEVPGRQEVPAAALHHLARAAELPARGHARVARSTCSTICSSTSRCTTTARPTPRYTRTPDGKYRVVINVEAKKFRADDQRQRERGADERSDRRRRVRGGGARARAGEGKPLYFAKHRIGSGAQRIEVVVDEEPARAGIDPYHKLIDRVTRDNTVAATRRDAASN